MLATRYGYHDARLIERADVGQYVASDAYHGGLFDVRHRPSASAELLPRLARAAIAAGVQIFEDSPVTAIETGERPLARTSQGAVRTRYLVLAGNAYLGDLVPSIRRKVMPVGTYMARDGAARSQPGDEPDPLRRGGHGHQVRARLLPAVGGSPAAVRRPRQLHHLAAANLAGGDAAVHAGGAAADGGSGVRV